MKITDVRVDFLKTGRTLLRVLTDDGVVGLAEAGWGHDRIFVAWLDDVIRPRLVGEDPLQPGRHWDRLFFGIPEGTPQDWIRVPMEMVGAVDVALWDLLGKACGQPVHVLLGGAARRTIPMYWSVGSGAEKTPDEMLADVRRGWDLGFRAFKIRMDWGPFRIDVDPAKDFRMFKLCRESLPAEVPLSFDANNGYSVSTAIMQGRRFEELGIAHFEEPLPIQDFPGMRQVVDALEVPVSSGEQESGRWRFRDLILLGNPDIIQPDILTGGGISEMRRIADLAGAWNKPVMPHSPFAGINSAASLNVYATLMNGTRPHEFSTEGTAPVEQIAELFEEPIIPIGGVITLPDRPGLGLTLNQRAFERAIVKP
ncbi:MAG TPA: mandelate racemase/muconate lactonizing enzyme family protein [Candidatus Saccharimonadales bacterium]|nr:mandelate racemase/muconate lactonizing enzyme family protein [Candidatus Saccharimonadales bacterium]